MPLKQTEAIPSYHLYGSHAIGASSPFFNIAPLAHFEKGKFWRHAHRHSNLFQAVWITAGSGKVMIDTEDYMLQEGSFCFISPGVVHSCIGSNVFEGLIMHFTPDFFISERGQQKLKQLGQGTGFFNLTLEPSHGDEIEAALLGIQTEFEKGYADWEEVVYAYLNIIATQLTRHTHTSQSHNGTRQAGTILVQRFKKLIDAHYREYRSVKDYAAILNVTPSYLNDTVKSATGKTAGDTIRNRIILEAKRMLLFSELSVSEIAYSLKYEDTAYFWRMFKKSVGLSPGKFRGQHQ